jgi:hypothetical protein
MEVLKRPKIGAIPYRAEKTKFKIELKKRRKTSLKNGGCSHWLTSHVLTSPTFE